MGVVELIQFLRQFTEPLASAAAPPECTKLFLYFSRSASVKGRLISPGTTWEGRRVPQAFPRVYRASPVAAVHAGEHPADGSHPALSGNAPELTPRADVS